MGGACCTHGGIEKYTESYDGWTWRKETMWKTCE